MRRERDKAVLWSERKGKDKYCNVEEEEAVLSLSGAVNLSYPLPPQTLPRHSQWLSSCAHVQSLYRLAYSSPLARTVPSFAGGLLMNGNGSIAAYYACGIPISTNPRIERDGRVIRKSERW